MGKVDELRNIIREELRAVLKEELPKMLKEVKPAIATDPKKALQEQVKTKLPGTLNTKAPALPKFSGNNPMASILNETAMDLAMGKSSFTTDDIGIFGMTQPEEVSVGSVGGMLASARPSSNIEMVQINEVPDFSGLMAKMKESGQI